MRDLADRFEVACLDDRQRLVQPDRLALLEFADLDVRRAGQAHLAARGEHVDRVVLVGGEQHAVTAGRLAEPVDFLAEREQLLPGFLERVHQLRVARGKRVDPSFELMHVTGAAKPAVGAYHLLQLLAQRCRLAAQFFQFGSVIAGHGGSEGLRTLGLTHIAPLPAPKVGAVTTSTLPAIQSLCAV